MPNKDDLAVLGELPEDGRLAPIIDWIYPWSEVAWAVLYLKEARAGGVVITV